MTEYAKLDENGVVLQVIVADSLFVATLTGTWVLTPYNGTTGKVGVGNLYLDNKFWQRDAEGTDIEIV